MKLLRIILLLKYLIPFMYLVRDGMEVYFDAKIQKNKRQGITVMQGEVAGEEDESSKQKVAIGVDENDPHLIYVACRVPKSDWDRNRLVLQFEKGVLMKIEKYFVDKHYEVIRQNVDIKSVQQFWEVSAQIEIEEV